MALLAACLVAGCSHSATTAKQELDLALARAVADDASVPGAVLAVDVPRRALSHASAAGFAHKDTRTTMTTDTAFLSASVGKLLVATAVYALAKRGLIDLDAPFTRYVDLDRSGARGLPVQGGDEALARVTVRQLLAHRSGLPDYFSDASHDGAPRLFDVIASEPERVFTRGDLFAYAQKHYAPVGAPGQVFHYADTNFDVLGLVLEAAANAPSYTDVVRTHVLEPLAMQHTWAHTEAAPVGVVIADVMVNGRNLRGMPALSADQAGGGYITTLADLTRLMRGLVRGEPVALDSMGAPYALDAMHPGIDVGVPLWRIRPGGVFFALGGMPDLVGHSGATGVWAYYVKDIDAVFVGAVNTNTWQEKHVEFLLSSVLPIVLRTEEPTP